MIGSSHSREAMKRFRDHVSDDGAFEKLQGIVQGILITVQPEGSAGAIV